MWSVERGVKCEEWSVECEVRVECEVWSVKCGV